MLLLRWNYEGNHVCWLISNEVETVLKIMLGNCVKSSLCHAWWSSKVYKHVASPDLVQNFAELCINNNWRWERTMWPTSHTNELHPVLLLHSHISILLHHHHISCSCGTTCVMYSWILIRSEIMLHSVLSCTVCSYLILFCLRSFNEWVLPATLPSMGGWWTESTRCSNMSITYLIIIQLFNSSGVSLLFK